METEREQDYDRFDDGVELSQEVKNENYKRKAIIKAKYCEKRKPIEDHTFELEKQIEALKKNIFQNKILLKEINYNEYIEINS